MQAPSYEWYAVEFGGALGHEEFTRLLRPARLRVEYLIGNKEVPKELQDRVKEAVCHMVDAYAEYGDGPEGGFTIGSFSVNSAGPEADGRKIGDDRARMCLAHTGLLFSGVA